MCGIAGIVGDVPKEEVIASMIEVMHHRGPDAKGFYVSKTTYLGHCRLSINDLSENANQPFIDEKQTTVVLVNGEIYNYLELKKQLLDVGYKFKSSSDSEVVLHGYLEYGLDFIRDLNGMFAIAIWNAIKNELILLRDRLGIKPLYYAHTNRYFLFASEIKALAQYENLDLSLDLQSFSEYLSFENYFSNRTLNRNIKMVQPGEVVSFISETSEVRREHFWQPAFGQKFHDNCENIYERYISIVQASVKRHLISDVPVGSYLSSGIDSSSVVYYASRLVKKKLETYTGCFGLSGFYDEATAARKIAEEFGCSNIRVNIQSEDFIDNIEDVLWHLDEPRVGMGSFSQYMVAKRAAKDVKVILTGHGGDEFFAGYPVFKAIYGKQQALGLILNSSLRELMYAFYFIVYPRFRKEAKYFIPNIYSIKSLQNILETEFLDCLRKETDALKELNALQSECQDEYERLTRTYLRYYLPALFTVEDKISMAFSLESRTPLCDNELLDFALSIPLSVKLTNHELKHIPRTAMRNKLPAFVFNLPKRGFPTPLGLWFKGRLNPFIREYILDNIVYLNMFNAERVEKSILCWIDSRGNTPIDEIKAHKVWILLNLIIYFKNQKRKYRRT
jgi:asparagine synthase (glutamine-hydrolysing)